MTSVFISHSLSDRELSSAIAERLSAQGVRVKSSHSEINWIGEQIESPLTAIRQSDAVFVMLSNPSTNVFMELGYALGARRSVAILVTGDWNDVPFDVRTLPYIKISGLDDHDIERLTEFVRKNARDTREESLSQLRGRQLLLEACKNPAVSDAMSGAELERAVAECLAEWGFRVRKEDESRDSFVDFFAEDAHTGERIVVEVKRVSAKGKVSVQSVQAAIGVGIVEGATAVMIVTTGDFTSSSRLFAESAPIPVALISIERLATVDPREDLLRLRQMRT